MDFIVENAKAVGEDITVKGLINKLLDCNMDDYIVIKDGTDKVLHGVSIIARKHEDTLACLFG